METANKKKLLTWVKNISLMVLGSLVLAFADAAFLSPYKINPGGVFGLAVAIDSLFPDFDCQDIVTGVVQVVLFIVGFFVIGKKFSLHTLIASLLYPVFFSLFYRLNVSALIIGTVDINNLTQVVLAGLAGGALVGTAVGLSFLGNGSTGGFDIICEIVSKYTDITQDLSSFVIDASVVVLGACVMWPMGNTDIWKIVTGIGSALVCAAMIQVVFVNANSGMVADIITDRIDEMLEYFHNDMDRGTTIIDITGGYTGESRKMIRVAFNKRQLLSIKDFIAKTDPRAFVTIYSATIHGEGFAELRRLKLQQKRREKKEAKKRGE